MYGPLIVTALGWVLARRDLSSGLVAVLLGGGLLAWTLLEWGVHRAMHVDTGLDLIRGMQDSAHLRHHREPDDLEHSVVRLRASLPLTVLLLGLGRAALGDWTPAVVVLCGLLIGYLFYEFVHLTSHANRRLPGLTYLHRHHLRHHYEQSGARFGVTSPLWDWVLGTLR